MEVTGHKLTEVGLIPADWDVVSLSEITDANRPISYGIVQTGPNVPNGVRCLRVLDINDGRINKSDLITTSRQISAAYQRTVLTEGDLVMPLRGKVGDVGQVDIELEGANLTRGVALIALQASWSAAFCKQLISWPVTRKRLEQAMNGSALQEIPIAGLRSFKLPMPSKLQEQSEIAAALGDVDALLAGLDRLIAKKRDLKQAAMQQLLTGQTRLPGFQGEWEERQLGDVCAFKTGPFGSALHKSDYISDGVPLVNPMHIVGGKIIPTREMTVTTDAAHRLSDFLLRDGDVIIGRRGDMGRCAIVRAHQHGWLCGTGSLIVRVVCGAVPEFIQRILSSREVIAAIENSSVGTTMTNLNQSVLRQLDLRLPEPAEQAAITAVLTDMDAELTALEARRTKTRALKQAMMQELLTGRTRLV